MVVKAPFKLILIGFLLVGAMVFLVSKGGSPKTNPGGVPNETVVSSSPWETKTDLQGEVEIKVTPQKLGVKEKENIFSIVLDTHSGSLDFDFTKIMVLKDDLGNEYKALSWTGGQGGHHLSGEIIFPRLNPKAQKVTLVVTGVGGVTRTFEWEI